MSRYPDVPRPNSPENFRLNRPVVSGGPEWAPQDRSLTRFGLLEVDLTYAAKTWAQIAVLANFFESVRGASGRFTFADFNGVGRIGQPDPGVQWTGLYVAKADGVTIAWDLPTFGAVASPVPVIYENGVAATMDYVTGSPNPAKAYHFMPGAGTDGVDQLVAQASISTVATAPSPATTGLSLVVHAGDGANFPATPFYANVWPTAAAPTTANIETIQVTGRSTDTLTIVRAQNGTLARTIVVGDQIAVPPAATIILSCDAWCRRAMRRAKFTTVKNPFVYNVPAVYAEGTVTIVEVRR